MDKGELQLSVWPPSIGIFPSRPTRLVLKCAARPSPPLAPLPGAAAPDLTLPSLLLSRLLRLMCGYEDSEMGYARL